MKTIQPFIDLGFYTVPLKGKLERLENGDKTPPKFETNWKQKHQDTFNEKASKLGGVITGAISNIIAIDCDDQCTLELFRALNPGYGFEFTSKGKPKGGGTIIYKYPTGESLESFSIQSTLTHLDFYADNGFVYLPSDENTTKEAWEQETYEELPKLEEIPLTVLTLLKNFQYQYTLSKSPVKEADKKDTAQARANYLAPQVELFVTQKKFLPSLFRAITPRDFRDLEQYQKFGYLHPENIPDGRGSEYLSKVSAILGADPSVSKDVYLEAMALINNFWAYPLDKKRLEKTIIDPMIDGKAAINGEPIWAYDEHWRDRGLAFTTKLGEAVEVFFDDIRASYHMVNYNGDFVKVFHKESDLFGYIEPVAIALPPRKELKAMVPVVRTVINPTVPFGFFSVDEYNREFNIFNQTPALAILTEPEPYKALYKRPEHIIKYLETFVPDHAMRHYLLGFLKKKLTTFAYSPVVLYFLGAHGSGKDTLVNILEAIVGVNYVAKPTTKEFLEQYNGWLVDKYFTQLDEYGNQLSTLAAKEEALGKIKAYTGKETIQIRQMRTDGFQYKHSSTFIMTANSNPLMMEDQDRRMALFETPNVLRNAEWVGVSGGMSMVIDKIMAEINDFCYYLATEVNEVSWDDYMTPPTTDAKRSIISRSLPAGQRLAYYLKFHMFEELEDLMDEHDAAPVLQHSADSRVYEDDLFDLYQAMTEGRGSKRGLTKIMREYDYEKVPTTKEGMKSYFYHVPGLAHYSPKSDFELEKTVVNIDGI